MHRFVHIAASCVLSAALVLGVSPLASFGLQAASAADTPKESDTTAQDEQTDPATYAAEALEEGDTFVFEDLVYTVTATGENPEAMLGNYYYDESDPYGPHLENAPTDSFTGGDVVLPDTVAYEGVDYTVTAIDAYAFYNDTSITSLTIPTSALEIGDYAFSGCSKVATLTLNEGLTTVGSYGLALGTSAGASTLQELTVPASVQTIGTGGFAYLRYLQTLTFTDTEEQPSQLQSIKGSAFAASGTSYLYYNKALTEIRIPAGVTSISTAAFAYNTALTTVIFECDTSSMMYRSGTSSSSASTAWFYQLTPTDETAFVFMQGTVPLYWNTDLPAYMCLDFYESEAKAATDEDRLGRAAVAYETSCSSMLQAPDEVKTFVFDDYGSVPQAPAGDYTAWTYADQENLLLTVSKAGRVYPDNVDLNDLRYATVTIDGAAVPSEYDYTDFDVGALLASLEVTDFSGNSLSDGADYDARIEQAAPLGTAYLVVEGMGAYSGTYEQSIKVTISAFMAEDDAGHAFVYEVVKQPTFDEGGNLVTYGTVSFGDGSGPAYSGSAYNIASVSIPDLVDESLTGQSYPFEVVEVADEALSGFTALQRLELPASVTTLGSKAVYGCKALTDVEFAEGLKTVGNYAFGDCSSLVEVGLPDSLTRLGTTTAVDSVGGSYVFNACTSLQKVTFGTRGGGGSATIATRVFDGCTSLTEIILNDNVDSLGSYAFEELNSLTTLTGLNGVSTIGYAALYGCSSLAFTDAGEEGVLALSDVTVNPRAFAGCASLTTLRLGLGVETGGTAPGAGYGDEGGYVFSGSGITAIEFEDDWTSIPAGIFGGLTQLEEVSIPDTVTDIGSSAFTGCSGLTSIVLPAELTRLGSSAFSGCSSLASVIFLGSGHDLTIGSQAFAGCTSLPGISIPEGMTELPDGCFSGCTALEEVSLPSTLEGIGVSCFGRYVDSLVEGEVERYSACTSLKTIDLPASVTSIGSSAFDGCSALTGPLDLSGVYYLDEYTFRGCASLDDVTIAGDVSLGSDVFHGCASLTSLSDGSAASGVVLPEGIAGLGNRAFYGCSSIESLTVPAAITTVPQSAFSGCSSLTELTLSEGIETIGQESFADCTSLATLATPASLAEIGTSAFSGCGKLTDLRLAEGLASIGRQAFSGCTSLPYVVLPSTISSIASGAFSNCYDLDAVDCTAVDVDAADIAADAFTTGNTDTCLVFVQTDAPKGLVLDNGHVLTVTCPETVTYTGSELTPVVLTCTDGTDAADFTWVDYTDNVIPGTASATVYMGAYEIDLSFEIENDGTYDPNKQPGTKQPITVSMVSDIPTQYYTGKAIKPAVKVGSYRQGTDYTVSYADNVNIGTAKATITPSAEIGGTPVTKTFKITVKKNAAYKVGSITYKIAKAKTNGKGSVTLAKCKKGKNVTVPAKVKIGGVSFKVAEIGAKAFKGAKNLKNIQIASSVKKIGKKAFFGCKKLSVVLFSGKKLPKLGKQAFAKTSSKVTVGVKSKPAQAEKKLRRAGLSKKAVVARG